ncbi:MAG: single-stranded-DNA-specific exonuclease RecJ [Holosporales bacterium]|jgi:single-stranded-DNA-specific exonuclease|nr:single-stranded-DNA-specific exonuclease RecJ [Holosporales bacterium]
MVKSFSDKVWDFLKCDEEKLQEIKTRTGLTDLVVRILVNRGFSNSSEIDSFLNCKLKNTIPEPSLLLDMDKGVRRIVEAILKKQNITVIGDYDVDGITSTYLVVKYLTTLGVCPRHYIPNRFTDGYGLSENSLNIAVQNKSDLIIVLDSGINSIEEIEKANNAGIDSVIIDHHVQLSKTLPNAVAVINPNRRDQTEVPNSRVKCLCAAGVVFLFLIALQRELRNMSFFKEIPEPNLLEFVGTVALGTLCDVMELRGMNRAIVKFALANERYPLGIESLMSEFKIDKITTPENLSFFIGPTINAAGRVGDPSIALNLLLEENREKSQKIASTLLKLNEQRKELEKRITAEAFQLINEKKLFENRGICVFGDDWTEGIIGIVAGRVKDKFNKPSFAISFKEDGIGKGSARSVPGVHLGEFFEKAREKNLIIDGGGHALAGGFTILRDKIEEFSKFANSNISGEFVNCLRIDCALSNMSDLAQISNEIKSLEPFGKGIEKPVFCLERVRITGMQRTANGDHLMLFFSGELGGDSVKALLFGINSKLQIVKAIESNRDALFDAAGYISFHEKYGVSFIIEDMRTS